MDATRPGISIVRTLPEDEWRRFVEEHPDGNVFHTPEMFQVFARTRKYIPELWAAVADGRVLALLVVVKIRLMNGPLRRLTTRAVSFGGVLGVPEEKGGEAVDLLLRAYTTGVDGSPLFTEVRNVSDAGVWQSVLRDRGFAYEEHLNYLIDLERTPEAVFQGFGPRTRKNIKRGLRRDSVVVKEVRGPEEMAACFGLVRRSYRLAGVPLSDVSLFESAQEVLLPRGMVRFSMATVGESPAASSIDLLFKNVIYGWYGGLDRKYAAFLPNELLTWGILKWGAENGYRHYDFGGAGRPDERYGVRDFKAKFAGEPVSFGRNVFVHSPTLYRLFRAAYRLRVGRRKIR